jgi:hypothetical protein
MSTAPAATIIRTAGEPAPTEIKVFMHSPVLYWWPLWAACLFGALWTWFDPPAATVVPDAAPAATAPADPGYQPLHRTAHSAVPGAVFVLTLLWVMLISNYSVRGAWAIAHLAIVVALVFMVSWWGWWGPLVRLCGLLHVHLNLGGYLVIGTAVLVIWVSFVFCFDRWRYAIFSASQVRMVNIVGHEERVYDAGGITFHKLQYDWFRRLIGLDAGDMVFTVGGAGREPVQLPNVILVSRRLQKIEKLLRTRDVD